MPATALIALEPSTRKCASDDPSIRYKRTYVPTPAIDAAVREAYRKQRQGDRAALSLLSRQLGWTRSAICKRGAELGVSRSKEHPWTLLEEDVLERFGYLAPSGIQRKLAEAGFQRSIAAIQVKLTRNRIKRNLNGYSANSLAGALGVDVHKILLWIRRGLLKAERRGTSRTESQGGDTWWISDRAVRRFILQAPEEIDLARVEKIWFLDLLTGGKICA
ncbi:MAG: hypothetical protein JO051_08835 [Acidobacteriaceae bacterium]|nr:hypothetical protein [Acidobacteriaceae bacterium]